MCIIYTYLRKSLATGAQTDIWLVPAARVCTCMYRYIIILFTCFFHSPEWKEDGVDENENNDNNNNTDDDNRNVAQWTRRTMRASERRRGMCIARPVDDTRVAGSCSGNRARRRRLKYSCNGTTIVLMESNAYTHLNAPVANHCKTRAP